MFPRMQVIGQVHDYDKIMDITEETLLDNFSLYKIIVQ